MPSANPTELLNYLFYYLYLLFNIKRGNEMYKLFVYLFDIYYKNKRKNGMYKIICLFNIYVIKING